MITENVFRAQFEIRVTEIDPSKKITILALMKLMQEASLKHIIVLKASFWDMKKTAWVLLYKEINIKRLPELGETVTIETYPAGFDRIFAYRDYKVYDASGNIIVSACSTWTLIDIASRTLQRIPPRFFDMKLPEEIIPLEKCNRKLNLPEGGFPGEQFKVNYMHLDWNGHVNNINYLKFILESNSSRFKTQTPSQIIIHFKAEAVEGDKLTVNDIKSSEINSTYHAVINNSDERLMTSAKITWKDTI